MYNEKQEVIHSFVTGAAAGVVLGGISGGFFAAAANPSIPGALATSATLGVIAGSVVAYHGWGENTAKRFLTTLAATTLTGTLLPLGVDHARDSTAALREPTPHVQEIQVAKKPPVNTLALYKPA